MAERLRKALAAGFKSRFHFDNVTEISKEAVCACMSDPRVANLLWCDANAALALSTPIAVHFKKTYIDALLEQQMRLAPPIAAVPVAAPAAAGHGGSLAGIAVGAAGANVVAVALPAPLPISGGGIFSGYGLGRTGSLIPGLTSFLSAQSNAALPVAAGPPASIRATCLALVTAEVEKYMSKPAMIFSTMQAGKCVVNDPMLFWKQCQRSGEFKLLLPMVRRAMCIPASEAPSERVFSKLAILIGRLRNRLSVGLVSDIMFLACNRKLFRKINLALSASDI